MSQNFEIYTMGGKLADMQSAVLEQYRLDVAEQASKAISMKLGLESVDQGKAILNQAETRLETGIYTVLVNGQPVFRYTLPKIEPDGHGKVWLRYSAAAL